MTALYTLLVILLFMAGLARWKRIYPAKRLVWWLLAPVLVGLLILVDTRCLYLVLALDAGLILIALRDLWSLPAAQHFGAERSSGRVASLQRPNEAVLTLWNRSPRSVELVVKEDSPPTFRLEPPLYRLQLPGKSRVSLAYRFTPMERGAYTLECAHLRIFSQRRLWQRVLKPPAVTKIDVYPNLRQLEEFAVMARTNRLSLMGVRRSRLTGQENEFERLRDYTLDDNYRHIDWRSTARRQKLTVRDFQSSHNQRLIFLLDCGRMMTNKSQGLTFLDHALNACLLLAYVALKKGDAVGMLCFSNAVHSYVAPQGGMQQMNRLLHASFDRFPNMVESRYQEAFVYLRQTCQKRSLVLLVSNLIDEVNAQQVRQHLTTLVGRHLPLGVMLRDPALFSAVERPPSPRVGASPEWPPQDLFRAAAAADILIWRHQLLRDMQSQGVSVLDLYPEEMTAGVINRYLEIKARHLL